MIPGRTGPAIARRFFGTDGDRVRAAETLPRLAKGRGLAGGKRQRMFGGHAQEIRARGGRKH